MFASCIPNKDLVYLQGQPSENKDIYKSNDVPYKLQVHDVITIDVKTTSPEKDKLVALFKKSNQGISTSLVNNRDGNQGFSNGSNYLSGFSVDRHGNIRLPYIGEINVLGYTTKEVREKLEQKILETFKDLKDFFVTVKLSRIKFTITGEVGLPGPKVINQNRISIIDALSYSGDILITGNKKNVVLWRTSVSGRKKHIIDLTQADAFNSEVFYIQPNDLIIVDPIKQKSWGTGTTGIQSLSTIISVFTLVTSTILLIRNL